MLVMDVLLLSFVVLLIAQLQVQDVTADNNNQYAECKKDIPNPTCPTPKDCSEILALGYDVSMTYTVYVGPYQKQIQVYCDMDTDGGGWTVLTRRLDGYTNFYRGWDEYADGFGDLQGEFYLGNHPINMITQQGEYEVRFDLEDFEGVTQWAKYDTFRVGGPYLNYPLNLTGYDTTSTAGDSMTYSNGMMFSTFDKDNDERDTESCAVSFEGAWWYNSCHRACLTGVYQDGGNAAFGNGIVWKTWHGQSYSLKSVEMKIR